MYRQAAPPTPSSRRGIILLVVISLLTLFAIVGLSFVLYADAEAKSSLIFREAEVATLPDMDPELLMAAFLSQLIYDVDNGSGAVTGPGAVLGIGRGTGPGSALRGHSLARTLYGYDDSPGARNVIPFNGTGRLHTGKPGGYPFQTPLPNPVDDYQLVNYTYFRQDGFVRDPERLGVRTVPNAIFGPTNAFVGGFNPPYTYPDLNNMFLAAVDASGRVLMPSFHRHWNFNPSRPFNDPSNPNWSNPVGKYLTLRPRPAEMGPGFPYPEDPGGDVKNLVSSPGYLDPISGKLWNNDSVWIDINLPVLTAPNGRKYKALVAPLIMDLDNRVNLNIHGNIRGQGLKQASNQGWGPWEVSLNWPFNLNRALTPGNQAVTEWTGLFTSAIAPAPPQTGRYGPGAQPGSPNDNTAPAGTPAHFYAPVDYDGANERNSFAPSSPLQFPTSQVQLTQPILFNPFPTLAQPGYGNGGAENVNHPAVFNYFDPTQPSQRTLPRRDDRIFPLSDMEALLRYGETGSPALTSELYRLCPTIFQDPRTRRLVTTHSFDVSQPGVVPWARPGTDPGTQAYGLTPILGTTIPFGGPLSFPSPSAPPPTYPQSEFASVGRAAGAALGRIDLNRTLPPYPKADATTQRITDAPGFQLAQKARQDLARDIFLRLRLVTTGNVTVPIPATANLDLHRWLAQLAVNIVDFIDTDDYMTPFDWRGDGTDIVFGTELPRVVLNEAYVEYQNDPTEVAQNARVATRFLGKVWLELLNPFRADPTDPNLADAGAARLENLSGGYPIYQVVIAQDSAQVVLAQPNNNQGDPTFGQGNGQSQIYSVVPSFRSGAAPDAVTTLLLPNDGNYVAPTSTNQGFYVLGPPDSFPGNNANRPKPTTQRPEMSYIVTNPANNPLPRPLFLLRRLACPHLPPQTANPRGTDYNPYITVDLMTYPAGLNVNYAATITAPNWPATPTVPVQRFSVGRRHPYAGDWSWQDANAAPFVQAKQQPNPPNSDQPQHTLFRHNANVNTPGPNSGPTAPPNYPPFDWLVHLDRQLISPMELLHVAAVKPHQLTFQFMQVVQNQQRSYNHRAPWFNPGSRLYRLFEFLETRSRAAGMVVGGRTPGKININTIYDPETFVALCDPQPSNRFTLDQLYRPISAQEVSNPTSIYWRLMKSRTPNALANGGPGPNDQPFWSLALGAYPATDPQFPNGGIDATLLRALTPPSGNVPSQRLFDPIGDANPASPTTHPFLKYELLTKIFNQLTTRSNVFAVWVTVGFFEVTDDTTRPVKLGAEIGRAENRHIRHRMFAIVDRSNLSLTVGQAPIFIKTKSAVIRPAGNTSATFPATVAIDNRSGSYEGMPWSIQKGMKIWIDVGPNQELVTVADAGDVSGDLSSSQISATFQFEHPTDCVLNLNAAAVPGNPGPQPSYNPRQDPAVVRYLSVIQ